MLQINPKLKSLFKGILKDYIKKDDLRIVYDRLGAVANSVDTVNLTNSKITDYDFLVIESGWGYSKATATIPTHLFISRNSDFTQCRFQVPTYGGNDYISLKHINDTSFIINGAVGADVLTVVYGAKIQR